MDDFLDNPVWLKLKDRAPGIAWRTFLVVLAVAAPVMVVLAVNVFV